VPHRVAISPAGDLIISESGGCRIRRISFQSNVISTIAGTGACGRSGDNGLAVLAGLGSVSAALALCCVSLSHIYWISWPLY